jgi:hypothetical protein
MRPNILDPNFKYIPSAKTDIAKTFAKARRELKNSTAIQDNNKPLVPQGDKDYKPLVSQREPLVSPVLNPGGFVLSADWFEME